MSEREQLQQRLSEWLGTWTTAPYGVLTSLQSREDGRGKSRVITFGLAATLDASLTIWSLSRLVLRTSRALEEVHLDSEQAFIDYCVEHFGAPAEEQTV